MLEKTSTSWSMQKRLVVRFWLLTRLRFFQPKKKKKTKFLLLLLFYFFLSIKGMVMLLVSRNMNIYSWDVAWLTHNSRLKFGSSILLKYLTITLIRTNNIS